MRCSCCDVILSDFEATRKNRETGEYLDMCNKCASFVTDTIQTIDRGDLPEDDVGDDSVEFVENDLWFGDDDDE